MGHAGRDGCDCGECSSEGTTSSYDSSSSDDGAARRFDHRTVPREQLLRMLRREQQLRMSDDTQRLYDFYHERHLPAPESIEKDIQRQVLREEGFRDSDSGLRAWWKINQAFPDDEEVRDTVVYMKHNVMEELRLCEGDPAPSAPLVWLEPEAGHDDNGGVEFDYLSLAKPGRPLVVAAGSYS